MLTAPYIKLMLESVTTSSYFFLTKKIYVHKVWESQSV